jgi:hypothetical protein
VCTVTITGDVTVTATFDALPTYTLTVAKFGTGTGTVTSNAGGINCGPTCSGSYTSGAHVTLMASPDAGSVFSGWSGPCAGYGSCTVSLTAAQTVIATFMISSGENLPPTAQSVTMPQVPRAQYTDPIFNRRYAFPLTGVDPEGGPLTFRITRFPTYQDTSFPYDIVSGSYYRLVDMTTGTFTSLWQSPVNSVVSMTTGEITGSPYFVYTAIPCFFVQYSSDSFEYVAIDDVGNVSSPATVTINFASTTCNHPA